MDGHANSSIHLPLSIIDRTDIGRLTREVDALDNFLEAAAVREPDVKPKMPKTSRLLDEILQQNKLDALLKTDRKQLKEFLEETKANAPVIHISFSADPPPIFAQKLVAWLREKIHPFVLLQVGLQPTIGAGCIVRTTNKQFDFSLRQRLISERGVLIKKLREVNAHATEAPETTSVPVPVAKTEPASPDSSLPASKPQPEAVAPSDQPVVPLAAVEPHHGEDR